MNTSRVMLVLTLALAAFTGSQARDGKIVNVEAVDYQEKVIYHSPETPGSTAWVGLWRFNNQRFSATFASSLVRRTNRGPSTHCSSPMTREDLESCALKGP